MRPKSAISFTNSRPLYSSKTTKTERATSVPTLIMVIGPGRSGTTMLDLMLGNGDNAFSCGEVYAWFRPWRTHHKTINCSCPVTPCPHWEKIKNSPENKFHSRALSALNVDFIIDSSKVLSWVIDSQRWARDERIRVLNLLIWKNPIELAYSHWKRGADDRKWRDEFINYYSKFLELNIPYYSISLEQLIKDPATKINDICKITGIKYFISKEKFWEGEHHHLFGSLGTRKQLENKSGAITIKPFDKDFQIIAKNLEIEIEKDVEIQKILLKLGDHEISRALDKSIDTGSNYEPPAIYPLWYYYAKLKRIYRRYLPQQWKHDQ